MQGVYLEAKDVKKRPMKATMGNLDETLHPATSTDSIISSLSDDMSLSPLSVQFHLSPALAVRTQSFVPGTRKHSAPNHGAHVSVSAKEVVHARNPFLLVIV